MNATEKALHDSEQRLRALVRGAPVVLFTLDKEGIFTLSEGRELGALDLQAGELVGRSAFDVYCESPQIMDNLHQALAGDAFTSVVEIAGAVFECQYSPLQDADGTITGTIGVAANVTYRRRAEGELRQREERFLTTFEAAAVGMAHVAPNGRWLRVNAKLCEISGYWRKELLDLDFLDLILPEDRIASLERVRRMFGGELAPYSLERRFIRKDGSRMWVTLSVSLAHKPSGEPEYLTCVAEDITVRKLKELVPDPLSERELWILRLVAQGFTNPQIARNLLYSLSTVKLSIQHILTKLKVSKRKEAVARAVEIGLISPVTS